MNRSGSLPVQVVETHISWLFFTPDRVFKLNKPVHTAFLDHSTPAQRIAASTRELSLNRRIAPDVYLGHADVTEDGMVVDRLLVMRRLPTDRSLANRLHGPDALSDVRSVARVVAAFHSGLEPVFDDVPLATSEGLAAFWRSNADDLAPCVGQLISATDHAEVLRLALDFLDRHGRLLRARQRAGMVRDGHGDLIADDIFMFDDGPRILDCLAFDDAYRIGDVLADIGFLAMDIERLAGPELATELLAEYSRHAGERHPTALAHHYIAYRAHVRAKVAAIRVAQGDDTARPLVITHHAQALDHLRRGQPTVLLLGGGPGTGKTTVARALAERLGWFHLDSDSLRKDLHGIAHDDHDVAAHPDLYASAATERTYATLIEHGAHSIEAGESVVLDATWATDAHRAAARRMAERESARLLEVECHVDIETARQRIRQRQHDPFRTSDAEPSMLPTVRDPWPEATGLSTHAAVDQSVQTIIEQLGLLPASGA